MSTDQPAPFKENLNREAALLLGRSIQAVHPAFALDPFADEIAAQLSPLELKARVAVFSAALRRHLPSTYPHALQILVDSLGDEPPAEAGMFKDFWYLMPVAHFVETYGLTHPAESLNALNAITRRHTGEFAIRPYILHHYDFTMATLHTWATSDSPHVRRLVSEGTRSRLPWASRLHPFIDNPSPALALLEKLRDDPARYVQKSVANHLNDIAKDHPDLVLDTVTRWKAESQTPNTTWIIRHALRSLVKQGHPRALALLGATDAHGVTATDLILTPTTLSVGDTLHFTVTLENTDRLPHNLTVDYALHFVRSRGDTTAKVFKLKQFPLAPGQVLQISKKHSFKPITTRRYYPGPHRLDILVNGRVLASEPFHLLLYSPSPNGEGIGG